MRNGPASVSVKSTEYQKKAQTPQTAGPFFERDCLTCGPEAGDPGATLERRADVARKEEQDK